MQGYMYSTATHGDARNPFSDPSPFCTEIAYKNTPTPSNLGTDERFQNKGLFHSQSLLRPSKSKNTWWAQTRNTTRPAQWRGTLQQYIWNLTASKISLWLTTPLTLKVFSSLLSFEQPCMFPLDPGIRANGRVSDEVINHLDPWLMTG